MATQALQLAGWGLTMIGQVQVVQKQRQGFVTWMAANVAMIALCAQMQLWWTVGMYLTNTAVCVWSYRKWGREESAAVAARRAALNVQPTLSRL